jgi:hypothetical protein
MMTVEPFTTDDRCSSFSKSRDRICLAYGRYVCPDPGCRHRACGLHVVRENRQLCCPQCGGPTEAAKSEGPVRPHIHGKAAPH